MSRYQQAWSVICLILALAPHQTAAQLARRQTRVEVVTPKAPQPVMIDGNRVLVYELHVTNLGRGALAFREIDVLTAGSSPDPIATYRDSALGQTLQRVGWPANTTDVTRLDPGTRTVVNLWLILPPQAPTPTVLRHRLRFALLDSADVRRDAGTESAIDSIMVPVMRDPPPTVRAPLDSGEWLAGDGPSNTSNHRRTLNALDGHGYNAERFAIDWQLVGPNGNTFSGDEHRNESFWGFGHSVHAVAAGEVIAILDSIPDNAPHTALPSFTPRTVAGNYVLIRIGQHQYATYAHLKRGSIRVHPHQSVARGDVIGLLGNSGQSTAPHLHFHITDGPSVIAAEGVPYVLESYNFLGYGKDFEENSHPVTPRRRELPAGDAVVGLP